METEGQAAQTEARDGLGGKADARRQAVPQGRSRFSGAGAPPFTAVRPLVNVSNSQTLGGGIGVFGAGCDMAWTVTYDELIFIHKGEFQLSVGDRIYDAGPGDTLWIPADTSLSYRAEEDVTFFYAVYPAVNSPSTGQALLFPTTEPRKV